MIDNRIVQCKCCNRLSSECFIKDGLCITCYEYNKQLKQQLAEKDKEIAHLKEMDNYHLLYELAGADETIANLKKQLEEKDKDKIQLAIQELEKVKNFVDGRTYCADYINKRMQDLKGE